MRHREFVVLGLVLGTSAIGAQTPITNSIPKVPSLNVPPLSDLFVLSTPTTPTTNPFSLLPGQQSRARAQLATTFTANLGVQLRYTSSGLTGPASVTIPAGQLFTEFLVTAQPVTTTTTVGVRGWVIDSAQAKLAQVEVRPNTPCNPTPTITIPTVVQANTSITVKIALSCAPATPLSIQVSSSASTVVPPPPGNVLAAATGVRSVSYQTATGNVAATTVVTISAFMLGTSPIVRAPDMQVAVTPH